MATLLSNQVDLLTHKARSLKSISLQTANSPGDIPGVFTRAALLTRLSDLIRDIDSTELGLFSLVTLPSNMHDQNVHESQIKRVEFSGATPLRNPPRTEDRPLEYEPEIYAQAALKCLHRYHPIRPMPRAHHQIAVILNNLEAAHDNISSLQVIFQRQFNYPDKPTVKCQIAEEEERITMLHSRLDELKKIETEVTIPNNFVDSQTNQDVSSFAKSRMLPSHEDQFWGTPEEVSRTLRFTENLLIEERADFHDLGNISFPSPIVKTRSFMDPVNTDQRPSTGITTDPKGIRYGEDSLSVLSDPAVATPILQPSAPPKMKSDQILETPVTLKPDRIRFNKDVEKIASKILSTFGDSLGFSPKPQKLSAGKEIVAHLEQISSMTPITDSPSQSSVSTLTSGKNTTSSQQILTSYLLVLLLTSAPHYSMPLNSVKDCLSAKAKSAGFSMGALGQSTTRILYGCVAKRLLRIDRSGGGQVVKFDY